MARLAHIGSPDPVEPSSCRTFLLTLSARKHSNEPPCEQGCAV